jgi:hypothetical protein
MKPNTKRSIFRWIHIVFGLTILGYIYGPQEEVAKYVSFFRYFYVPMILLSGFWLWKGEAVRRRFTKPADQMD